MWLSAEIGICACDLAEVIGTAIALNLLFGIPLFAGVCLTVLDVLLVLLLQHRGVRYLEAFVVGLIWLIAGGFLFEVILAQPDLRGMGGGRVPYQGRFEVAEIQDAYMLLVPALGPFAAIVVPVALLAAGQNSTVTATLAGQIVMEGFGGNWRVPAWLRRLATRLLAILP